MADAKNKPTRRLIVAMIVLVGIAIFVAKFYYTRANTSIDPRIRHARELYKNYNQLAMENRFFDVLDLLDSIENIYSNVPHYKKSYEVGVLYNNRTATFLTMALFKDSLKASAKPFEGFSKDSLIQRAERAAEKSIQIYEGWLEEYDSLDQNELHAKISDNFLYGLEKYDKKQQEKFINARVRDLADAREETKRRLSVSYTNYGVIKRYHEEYKEAAMCYKKAIDLWDRNLTAENNLNRLFGRPLKKRNIIQKLFPPEKN